MTLNRHSIGHLSGKGSEVSRSVCLDFHVLDHASLDSVSIAWLIKASVLAGSADVTSVYSTRSPIESCCSNKAAHEHIMGTVVWFNEAVAMLRVEPNAILTPVFDTAVRV
jgi:hypothetical protein